MDNKITGRDSAIILLIVTKRSEKGSTLFVPKSSTVDAKNSPVKCKCFSYDEAKYFSFSAFLSPL